MLTLVLQVGIALYCTLGERGVKLDEHIQELRERYGYIPKYHRYKEGGRMVTVSDCGRMKFIEVANDMIRVVDKDTGETLGKLKLNSKGAGKDDK